MYIGAFIFRFSWSKMGQTPLLTESKHVRTLVTPSPHLSSGRHVAASITMYVA